MLEARYNGRGRYCRVTCHRSPYYMYTSSRSLSPTSAAALSASRLYLCQQSINQPGLAPAGPRERVIRRPHAVLPHHPTTCGTSATSPSVLS